jgi:thioredoxin 1
METTQLTSLDHLNQVTANNANVLLIVSRNACPGCDALTRALENNALLQDALADVTVVVAKLEKIPTIAPTFGLRQAPTMILFKEDEEVSRLSGFTVAAPLIEALQKAFNDVAQAA